MTRLVSVVALLCLLPLTVLAAGPCGDIQGDAGGYGPFNYNDATARAEKIPIIEEYHFTRNIEYLIGADNGTLGGNLDYMLRHVPNHHRALDAMMRLALREGQARPRDSRYPMQCWFQRAREFAPNDGIVVMVQGVYEAEKGNLARGIALMEKGLEIQPGNPNIHYNLGLLYFRAGRYDEALTEARAAYSGGFPLPGLREKLKSVGRWSEGGATSDS